MQWWSVSSLWFSPWIVTLNVSEQTHCCLSQSSSIVQTQFVKRWNMYQTLLWICAWGIVSSFRVSEVPRVLWVWGTKGCVCVFLLLMQTTHAEGKSAETSTYTRHKPDVKGPAENAGSSGFREQVGQVRGPTLSTRPCVFKQRHQWWLHHKRWPASSSICAATPGWEVHHVPSQQPWNWRIRTPPGSIPSFDANHDQVAAISSERALAKAAPLTWAALGEGRSADVKADLKVMSTASWAPWWRGRPDANTSRTRSDSDVHVTQSPSCIFQRPKDLKTVKVPKDQRLLNPKP